MHVVIGSRVIAVPDDATSWTVVTDGGGAGVPVSLTIVPTGRLAPDTRLPVWQVAPPATS